VSISEEATVAQLELEGVHTSYGLSQVLFDVSLEVERGEVVALLGRNGVGKTTVMRTIMGLTPPRTGVVRWEGKEIQGMPPYRIARRGIGFVPEDRRIFPDLTVWENLDMGRRPGPDGETRWTEERIFEIFPVLEKFGGRRGGHLSGGEQQMLTIARSLMGNPRLLLLDEPSEGLAPLVVDAVRTQIDALRNEGLSLVLAEQSLDFVLSLSDRVYVLEKGEVKFSGTASQVRDDDEVLRRYLTV
jgi:branched-chain amino acid transport system ATP-binding protein